MREGLSLLVRVLPHLADVLTEVGWRERRRARERLANAEALSAALRGVSQPA